MQSLKNEINELHEKLSQAGEQARLKILSRNVDEILFTFLDNAEKQHSITCNIFEGYPDQAPLWCTASDNTIINNIIDKINSLGRSITSASQVLLNELCTAFGLSCDANIDLCNGVGSSSTALDCEMDSADDADSILSDDLSEVDVLSDTNMDSEEKADIEMMKPEQFASLERIKQSIRKDQEQGMLYGSVQATDRIMKELKEIYKSEGYKTGVYTVSINNDNLYNWDVFLQKVDPDSPLMDDIKKLAPNPQHIHFSISFGPSFPFEPPFVRVVAPHISRGYVMRGGAICMELLTRQGWSSAYSIESLITQISATLVKGKARITFNHKGTPYTFERALCSFNALVESHEAQGWVTPPKEEG
ncbi:hypothetical protein ACHWQZ_G010776 [Mnemiopsis leidyi]